MLITNDYKIQENNTIIGEICLWQYEGFEYPHIEFEIKKDYQKQGFMTSNKVAAPKTFDRGALRDKTKGIVPKNGQLSLLLFHSEIH